MRFVLFFQCTLHSNNREMVYYSGMYSDSKTEYVLHLRQGGFYLYPIDLYLTINTTFFSSRIMTIRDAKVLYDLIDEARKVYMETQGKRIRIFTVEELSCSSLLTELY